MRAIILAGGHATRLWPITRNRAKPLLPIGDVTLIERLLDQLAPVSSRVLVSTNALFADQFAPVVRGREGVELAVEEQTSEDEKPGALGALIQLIDDLDDDEPLMVVAGDNYYGFDLASFAKAAGENDGPTVAVKDLEDDTLASQFGIVDLDAGTRIGAFHEKPEDPPTTLAATALYHYPTGWRSLFDHYEKAAQASEDPGKMFDAPGRILEWAVAQGRPVHAWAFDEAWHDIGTPIGYLEALRGIQGDRYVAGTVDGCELGDNVYVFQGASATGSTLEDTILLPEAVVEGSNLTRCIVDAQARVRGLTLTGSIVGPYDLLQASDEPAGS